MAKSELIHGIGASPGVAIGPVRVLARSDLDVRPRHVPAERTEQEVVRFLTAVERARLELEDLLGQAGELHEDEQAQILDVQLMLLKDPTVLKGAAQAIREERVNAEHAFGRIFTEAAARYEASATALFRERAVDFRDVARRVLRHLTGSESTLLDELAEPCIVVAHDLEPSETIHFQKGKVLAIATDSGCRTSHSAILARSHGIPAVVALRNVTRQVKDGDLIVVDGFAGVVLPRPPARKEAKYRRRMRLIEAHGRELESLRDLPAVTPDGRKIELSANLEMPEEIEYVLASGPAGIGLYRTEFFYLGRAHLPSEEEQSEAYLEIARRLHPRPVIIRTMDLGGDKVASYLGTESEANPFLGWRGIRFALHHPTVFRTQLRAIYRASVLGNVKLMFPMVSTFDELRGALGLCAEVRADLKREGVAFDETSELGMMVETPSAVWSADLMAREVAFFSIGSNDLIQYTLAIDRGNEKIAYLYEPLDPSILRSVRATVVAGHLHGRWVGVCGEMAGDPRIAILLLGMDVDEFSVSPYDLPRVKAAVRAVTHKRASEMARECLKLPTARDIRAFLDRELDPLLPAVLLGGPDDADRKSH